MARNEEHSSDSFRQEFERLLQQLDSPPIIEVREPNRTMKLLSERLARCPAAHNRLLLDQAKDEGQDAR